MHWGGLLACRDTAHLCTFSQEQENQRNELPQHFADLFLSLLSSGENSIYIMLHMQPGIALPGAAAVLGTLSEHKLTLLFC